MQIKRVYEPVAGGDGYRVLVDRLWPRGMSKEKAKIDEWMKDIAPSNGLRKWFGHKQERWEEFKNRYKKELSDKKNLVEELKKLENKYHTVTLVYGAKDTKHNQAVVLLERLQ